MDLNHWVAVATIVQGIAAIIALLLTFALSKQTTKIRELSDVTDAMIKQNRELANQTQELIKHTDALRQSNEIFQKSYELEVEKIIIDKYPYFKVEHSPQLNHSNGFYKIFVKNVG